MRKYLFSPSKAGTAIFWLVAVAMDIGGWVKQLAAYILLGIAGIWSLLIIINWLVERRKTRGLGLRRLRWVYWTLVLITIITIICGAFYAHEYSQINTPTPTQTEMPTPTPTVIGGLTLSHPSPEEIYDNISQFPPYLQDNVRQSYQGSSVIWDVRLYSTTNSSDGERIFSNPIDQTNVFPMVVFTININDYPQLIRMNKGQEFIVQGVINSVDSLNIELGNCSLRFP